MNLDDYSYEFEGRRYLNPQPALDEQNAFINNLRNIQTQNNAQIAQQTRGLGTQVPSSAGGLVGGSGYFKSRYQTPRMNQTIADLRTAAQGQALNTVLTNELNKAKARYYAAKRSAAEKAAASGSGSGSNLNELLSKLMGDGSSGTVAGNYLTTEEEDEMGTVGNERSLWDKLTAHYSPEEWWNQAIKPTVGAAGNAAARNVATVAGGPLVAGALGAYDIAKKIWPELGENN